MLRNPFKIILSLFRPSLLLALTASVGTIASATFARQLLAAVNYWLGGYGATICFWLLTPPVMLLLVLQPSRRSLASLSIALGVVLFSLHLPLFEERIHLLQYGILGFLWTQTFLYLRKGCSLAAVAGCLAALATACLDELIQAILPYRVGDFRDIGFDLVGIIAGLSICIIQEEKNTLEIR